MQAQTEPQASPCRSSSAFTCRGSMWLVSSTGISTVWKPHFLNVLNKAVLSLVNGEVKRKVLMPNLIMEISLGQLRANPPTVKDFLTPKSLAKATGLSEKWGQKDAQGLPPIFLTPIFLTWPATLPNPSPDRQRLI